MNIAIDVDGVILNMTTIFKYAFTYYNEEYYPPDSWDMLNYPEHIRERFFSLVEDENIMTIHMPFKGSIQSLTKKFLEWKKKDCNLYIVSSRYQPVAEKTKQYLEFIFPDIFEKILVIQGSKIPYLQEYDIDLLIDDGNKNIEACMKNGIDCILISDDHQVYNHCLRDKVEWYKSLLDIKL